MPNNFETIVIGTGGVGSATLYHLAQRGVRVLGLDQFPPAHDRGSSHGRTRIIRQAYFEHPDYVPLLFRAYELWSDLSEFWGKPLYHEVGLLQIGMPSGHVVEGVRAAARLHNLPIENLTARETEARFPGFRVPDGWEAVFESRAGYLDVEDCVSAHLQAATRWGAVLQTGITVRSWRREKSQIVVETDSGRFHAAKLIITAGAWAGSLLRELGVRLEVRRKALYWYPVHDESLQADAGCPTFLFETPNGVFYGFPQIDQWGVKLAEHSGGPVVTDPLHVSRELDTADQARVEQFAAQHLPGLGRPATRHATCMYTMSPDSNFIVDLHPDDPDVAFAAGLSGHGFKFACVLGEALADLSIAGRTSLPIGFLGCKRPALWNS